MAYWEDRWFWLWWCGAGLQLEVSKGSISVSWKGWTRAATQAHQSPVCFAICRSPPCPCCPFTVVRTGGDERWLSHVVTPQNYLWEAVQSPDWTWRWCFTLMVNFTELQQMLWGSVSAFCRAATGWRNNLVLLLRAGSASSGGVLQGSCAQGCGAERSQGVLLPGRCCTGGWLMGYTTAGALQGSWRGLVPFLSHGTLSPASSAPELVNWSLEWYCWVSDRAVKG